MCGAKVMAGAYTYGDLKERMNHIAMYYQVACKICLHCMSQHLVLDYKYLQHLS